MRMQKCEEGSDCHRETSNSGTGGGSTTHSRVNIDSPPSAPPDSIKTSDGGAYLCISASTPRRAHQTRPPGDRAGLELRGNFFFLKKNASRNSKASHRKQRHAPPPPPNLQHFYSTLFRAPFTDPPVGFNRSQIPT